MKRIMKLILLSIIFTLSYSCMTPEYKDIEIHYIDGTKDSIELAMELEKTFNIDADSYEIDSIKTVGDAIKIIDEALKAKP